MLTNAPICVSVSHLHPGSSSGQEAGDQDHQPYGGHAGPEDHEGQLCGLHPEHTQCYKVTTLLVQ